MRITNQNRLLLVLGCFLILGPAGLLISALVWPVSPINAENSARIKAGMTEKEVIEILGGPGVPGDGFRSWDAADWVVTIYFDGDGLVIGTMHGPNPQSFLSKLRRWFRPF